MYDKPGGFGRRRDPLASGQMPGHLPSSSSFGAAQSSRYSHERTVDVADDIDFEILGNDLQFVEIELDPGESVIAEPGAMVWKDFDVEPSTLLDADSKEGQGLGSKLLSAGKRIAVWRKSVSRRFYQQRYRHLQKGEDSLFITHAGQHPAAAPV